MKTEKEVSLLLTSKSGIFTPSHSLQSIGQSKSWGQSTFKGKKMDSISRWKEEHPGTKMKKSCYWLSLDIFSMVLNKLCIYMHVLCALVYIKHDWAEWYTIHRYLRCRYEKTRHLCYPHELIIQWKRQLVYNTKKKKRKKEKELNKCKVGIIMEDKIENLHLKVYQENPLGRYNIWEAICLR